MLSDITLAAPFIRACEKRTITDGRRTKTSVFACHRLFYVVSGQGEIEFDGVPLCVNAENGGNGGTSVSGDGLPCIGGIGGIGGGIGRDCDDGDGGVSGCDCTVAEYDGEDGDGMRRHALSPDTVIYVPSGRCFSLSAHGDLEILSLSFDFTHDRRYRRFDRLEYAPEEFLCEYIAQDAPMAQPYFSDVELLRSADMLLPDIRRIFDCREAQLIYFKETSEAYLKSVLCNLLSLGGSGVRARRAYDRIFKYVALHYAEQIDNAELAGYVGYHTNYVNALVLAATGTTLRQFITDFRLRRAKELLLAEAGSLDDIALACGFGTASYFCYCFKAAFGVSPHKFAKAHSGSL